MLALFFLQEREFCFISFATLDERSVHCMSHCTVNWLVQCQQLRCLPLLCIQCVSREFSLVKSGAQRCSSRKPLEITGVQPAVWMPFLSPNQ